MQYDKNQVNDFIFRLQERRIDVMTQTLLIAKLEFTEDENDLSEKLRWYLITVDDILNHPDILSDAEKSEFINLHLAYVKKYRKASTLSN